jgi:hypothetical protein
MAKGSPASAALTGSLPRSASRDPSSLIEFQPNPHSIPGSRAIVILRWLNGYSAPQECFADLLSSSAPQVGLGKHAQSAAQTWNFVTPPPSHSKRTTEALAAALSNIR